MPRAAQQYLHSRDPQTPRDRPRQVSLRLRDKNSGDSNSSVGHEKILDILSGLPELSGSPIDVRVLPKLFAYRGKLFSGAGSRGTPVHAASFIRRREIVLETELFRKPPMLRLITVHEIFHFVWARLGNRDRAEYTKLLHVEALRRARGEMGESSGRQKGLLQTGHSDTGWTFYVCESFCDTAAWLYAGVRHHKEFTMASRWRNLRRLWFEENFAGVRRY